MAPGLPEDEAVSLLTGYREWGIRHLPSHLRSSLLPLYSHLAGAGWDVHAGGEGASEPQQRWLRWSHKSRPSCRTWEPEGSGATWVSALQSQWAKLCPPTTAAAAWGQLTPQVSSSRPGPGAPGSVWPAGAALRRSLLTALGSCRPLPRPQ